MEQKKQQLIKLVMELGSFFSNCDGDFDDRESAFINNYIDKISNVEGILKERLDRAERKGEFISPMLPSSVLRKFNHLCDKNGLPRFTMHAERHANASEMLVMGVPDKYAMKRLGQSSPNMIKNVYQHLFEDKEKEYSKALSSKFETLMNKKTDPENDTKQG